MWIRLKSTSPGLDIYNMSQAQSLNLCHCWCESHTWEKHPGWNYSILYWPLHYCSTAGISWAHSIKCDVWLYYLLIVLATAHMTVAHPIMQSTASVLISTSVWYGWSLFTQHLLRNSEEEQSLAAKNISSNHSLRIWEKMTHIKCWMYDTSWVIMILCKYVNSLHLKTQQPLFLGRLLQINYSY